MACWSKLRSSVWTSACMVVLFAGTVAAGARKPLTSSIGTPPAVPPTQSTGWQGKPDSTLDGAQEWEQEPVEPPAATGKKEAAGDFGEAEHQASGPESTGSEGTRGLTLDEAQVWEPVESPNGPGTKDGDKSGKDDRRTPTAGSPVQRDEPPGRMAPAPPPTVPGEESRDDRREIPRSRAAKPRPEIVLLLDDGAGAKTIKLGDADPGTVVEFRVKGRVVSNVYWRLVYTASDFSSNKGKTFPIWQLAYGGTDLEGLTPLASAGDIYPLRAPTGETGFAFEHVFVLTFPEDAEPGEYSTEIRYAALPVDQTRRGKDGEKESNIDKNKSKPQKTNGKGGSSG